MNDFRYLTFICLWENSKAVKLIFFIIFPQKVEFNISCKLSSFSQRRDFDNVYKLSHMPSFPIK